MKIASSELMVTTTCDNHLFTKVVLNRMLFKIVTAFYCYNTNYIWVLYSAIPKYDHCALQKYTIINQYTGNTHDYLYKR